MASPVTTVNQCFAPDHVRKEVNKAHRIVERERWGKLTPNYADMEEDGLYTGIAVHHIGDWLGRSPHAVEKKHMTDNGWDDVGYHYMIHLDGTFYEGRKIQYKGSHLKLANTGRIGILLMGDFDHQWYDRDDTLTDQHFGALRRLIASLRRFYNIRFLGGHQEFPGQAQGCPGNVLLPRVQALRTRLNLQAP